MGSYRSKMSPFLYGGQIIGRKSCDGTSSGAGGITTPAWQKHRLAMDEKWVVPMGAANVAFNFDPAPADISIVVKYWPWLLPFDGQRGSLGHPQTTGWRLIWVLRPVD
jgi:hypothetical protein